jgi:hypothetical protein
MRLREHFRQSIREHAVKCGNIGAPTDWDVSYHSPALTVAKEM